MNTRTVLITGSSRGIGAATAEKFASLGYSVVINYHKSKEQADALSEKLSKAYGEHKILAVCADISDSKAVDTMLEEINARFGGVDILINNAGISHISMLCDTSEEEWDNIFAVNTKSAFLTSKKALPYMVSNKWGRIINISSMWGISGASCEVAYSASKSALTGFTKALAKELAPSGITVNCIAPGLIDTDMNKNVEKDALDAFINEIPVMRAGMPDEIAHVAAFLADEKSSYITGQIISVDGGIN